MKIKFKERFSKKLMRIRAFLCRNKHSKDFKWTILDSILAKQILPFLLKKYYLCTFEPKPILHLEP